MPYLGDKHGTYKYGERGFLDFPSRAGWNRNLMLNGDFNQGRTESSAEKGRFRSTVALLWTPFSLPRHAQTH